LVWEGGAARAATDGAAAGLGLCSLAPLGSCTGRKARPAGRTHPTLLRKATFPACAEKAFAPFTAPIRPFAMPTASIPSPSSRCVASPRASAACAPIADIDLTLARGEILGCSARKRAGKKTTADEHPVRRHRASRHHPVEDVRMPSPFGGRAAAGIGMVHSIFTGAALTCSTTLLVGLPGRGGRLDRPGGLAGSARSSGIRLALDADRPVASLSVGEQQRSRSSRPVSRRPHPDPRRADGRCSRPPRSRAVRGAAGDGVEGLGINLSSRTSSTRCAPSPIAASCCATAGSPVMSAIPGTPAPPRLARLMCATRSCRPSGAGRQGRRRPRPRRRVDAGHAGMPAAARHDLGAGRRDRCIAGSRQRPERPRGVIAGMLDAERGRVAVRGEVVTRSRPMRWCARSRAFPRTA